MRTGPAVPFPFLCDIWGESPEREREKKCRVRSVIGSLIHVFILYVRLCVCVCPPNPAGHLGGLAWSTVPLLVSVPKADFTESHSASPRPPSWKPRPWAAAWALGRFPHSNHGSVPRWGGVHCCPGNRCPGNRRKPLLTPPEPGSRSKPNAAPAPEKAILSAECHSPADPLAAVSEPSPLPSGVPSV